VNSNAAFIVNANFRARFVRRAMLALFAALIASYSAIFISFAHAATVVAAPSLSTARSNHTATLLTNGKLLVVGGQDGSNAPLSSVERYDPFANTWSAGAALTTARSDHTATLLDNGRVLVVGGRSTSGTAALNTAQLYDPTTNTWSNAGNLAAARSQHTATRLRSGKVLVIGGQHNANVLASAEIYDPVTNAWTSAGSMATARRLHTATAVAAGIGDDVIVIGGLDVGSNGTAFGLTSVERYSASSNSWFTFSAQLSDQRYSHTATARPNGDILIAGGISARISGLSVVPTSRDSVERFDYGTLTVAAAGQLRDARGRHSATLLPSGKLMLIGGVNDGTSPAYLQSIETFDLATGDATLEPAMATARADHTATLIPTGAILVAGGRASAATVTASAALVRTAAESSVGSSSNCGARFDAAIAMLADGRVLVAGGRDGGGVFASLADARIYDPVANTCASVAPLPSARRAPTLTLLPSGKLLAAGGFSSAIDNSPTSDVFVFDPSAGASGTWATLPSLTVPRGRHTATLLPDGRVLIFGGTTGISGSAASVEIFDPATNTWLSQLAPISRGVGRATALLSDGRLLLAGGAETGSLVTFLPSGVYDPVTGSFTTRLMQTPRADATATLLANGKVLVVGGYASATTLLATAELFDPATQSWTTTPPLANARYGHTATLLASGEVLVAGGGASPTTSEIYDPVSNTWRSGPALQASRRLHRAIAAPNGGALLLSGLDSGTVELIGPMLAPVSSLAPALNTPSASFAPNAAINFTGSGFRPAREASGGNTAQSASHAPVFELQRIDNDQRLFLPQAAVTILGSNPFTDTSFAAAAIDAGFPRGHARLRTWVNGVPSAERIVLVAVAPYQPSAPTATATSNTSATVTFSANAFFNGGSALTKYAAVSTPDNVPASCNVPCSSVVVSGLTPGSTYTFQARAANAVGDGGLSLPSNSVTLPQRSSTTTVVSSVNPSVYAQSVTFTATVNVAGGAALAGGGTMNFTADGNTIAGCAAVPVTLVGGNNVASCTTSTLGVQNWNITATFSGDAQTAFSFGQVVQTVNKANQTIANARFTLSAGNTTITQTWVGRGTAIRADTLASENLLSFAVAPASQSVCSLSPLPPLITARLVNVLSLGVCTVLIDHPGDANYNAAPQVSVSIPVFVLPTVNISGVPAPMIVGQSARVTVSVTGTMPTGTVTLAVDNSAVFALAGCNAMPLVGSGNTRTASCVMRAVVAVIPDGFVNATYSGDANHVSNDTFVDEPGVIAAPSLNIDLSPAPGTANDAATDGLMILRYLAGFTGTAITDNAMHPSFDRSPPDVPPYLESIRAALDVNGDGRFDVAIDGLLIVRYMRVMRTATGLFIGVDVGNVMTANQIQDYLQLLMP
jgi:N-acetylneuraminic acid mutarotase